MAVFHLKVELDEIKPKIFRELLVDSGMTFYELHHVLQIAFEWWNYHQFQFDMGNDKFIGLPDPELEQDIVFAGDVILEAKLVQGQKFVYEYDFGDGWNHIITVQSIIYDSRLPFRPVCLDGSRRAPHEDSGGIDGYYNVCESLANKKHPEHDHIKRWAGKGFDPERFDFGKINRELADFRGYMKKFEKGKGGGFGFLPHIHKRILKRLTEK